MKAFFKAMFVDVFCYFNNELQDIDSNMRKQTDKIAELIALAKFKLLKMKTKTCGLTQCFKRIERNEYGNFAIIFKLRQLIAQK